MRFSFHVKAENIWGAYCKGLTNLSVISHYTHKQLNSGAAVVSFFNSIHIRNHTVQKIKPRKQEGRVEGELLPATLLAESLL